MPVKQATIISTAAAGVDVQRQAGRTRKWAMCFVWWCSTGSFLNYRLDRLVMAFLSDYYLIPACFEEYLSNELGSDCTSRNVTLKFPSGALCMQYKSCRNPPAVPAGCLKASYISSSSLHTHTHSLPKSQLHAKTTNSLQKWPTFQMDYIQRAAEPSQNPSAPHQVPPHSWARWVEPQTLSKIAFPDMHYDKASHFHVP